MAGGLLAALIVLAPAGAASAHPLGNFTVNTYSGVRIQPDRVVIDMVVDMAEIPAFQVHGKIDTNSDGTISDPEAKAYATTACAAAATKASLSVGGRSASLRVSSGDVTFPPGAAGLSTLRLTCALVADTGELRSEQQVVFRNTNYIDRVGWREITAVGDRTTVVASNVKGSSTSNRLTAYPADLLSSPLDERSATVRARPGGPAAADIPGAAAVAALRAPQPRGVDALTRSFTALVARQRLSVAFGMLALALAVALGAVHALAPGHGKTVMAAYLVGERGSLRQAALIALTVTATHTIGVLVLGTVLSASTSLAPESIYPLLGLTSGLLLAAIGVSLGRRALRRRPLVLPVALASAPALVGAGVGVNSSGHDHTGQSSGNDHHEDHPPPHSHDHDHGTHRHGGRVHTHVPLTPDGSPVHWKTLVPMGLAGGMVPSPSALVVLLGAIALGRAWFGVALVIAYGLGMAVTLTGAGLLLVRARGAIERRMNGPRAGRLATLTQALPLITATAIIGGGLYLAARGAAQL